MKDGEVQMARRGSLGYVLILFAGLVLFLTRRIESFGLGSNADPGARLFPIALSIVLAIAGGLVIWIDLRGRAKCREVEEIGIEVENEIEIEGDAGGSIEKRLQVGGLLAAFLIYIVALPWLGFGLSTLTLATLMMRILSASWKLSITVSIVLLLIVYLLFGLLFHVPLPTGILGLPF